jgi:hypothetical protein
MTPSVRQRRRISRRSIITATGRKPASGPNFVIGMETNHRWR